MPNPVDTTTNTANYDSSAVRAGGFLGHNWQIAPTWVTGVEADLGWANNNKTQAGIPGTHDPIIGSPTATALANDRTSVDPRKSYLNGGVAWQKIEVSARCIVGAWCSSGSLAQSNSQVRSGWALGAGVEGVLSDNWLMRAEYHYADFGTISGAFFGGSVVDDFSADVKVRTNTAFLSMVYRFK